MATPPLLTALVPPSAVDVVGEAERADERETADDAPAPVHPEPERQRLVRDAYGNDPYGGDRHGPDGERDEVELGKEPYDLPDPQVAALRRVRDAERTRKP